MSLQNIGYRIYKMYRGDVKFIDSNMVSIRIEKALICFHFLLFRLLNNYTILYIFQLKCIKG